MFDNLPDLVNGNEVLVRRGRFCSVDFMLEDGDQPWFVSVREGRIATMTQGPALMRPWRFAVRAQKDAWRQFWQPMPRPGFHDIFAMTKLGVARVEGDLQPLMANLRYFKDMLALPRGRGARP